MEACSIPAPRSRKRQVITITLMVIILSLFWGTSRYPDLIAEYTRASQNALLERNVGSITKDEMINTKHNQTNLSVAATTTINWIDANKIGMSFGIVFSAIALLLLEQSKFLYLRAAKPGWRGVLSGLLIGMPMGVCTNCATPIGLGIKKAGSSYETAFTALIASPTLNPVGLVVIATMFPMTLLYMRIGVLLAFLFLVLPLLICWLVPAEERQTIHVERNDLYEIKETWKSSFTYCVQRFLFYLWYIVKRVVPAMLVIGAIAAVIATFFPPEKLLVLATDNVGVIIIAGLIGTLLPMPMFVDIVLTWLLVTLGLPFSVAVTLLITFGSTSLFAMYIMGRHASWPLSIAVSTSIAILGISAGISYHYYQQNMVSKPYVFAKDQFTEIKTHRYPVPRNNLNLVDFFAGGVSLMDFDNDNKVDVFLPGKYSSVLFKNLGNDQFKATTIIPSNTNAIAGIWGDYNNDGFPDLYLVNYKDNDGNAEANQLYRNNGDGTFTDVSNQVGLIHKDFSSSAAWADIDNDGDLDLFVSNYGNLQLITGKRITGFSQFDRLYRNDNGKFVDITAQAGVAGKSVRSEDIREIEDEHKKGDRGFSFQPVWFDYNNDNLIDLYVGADFGTSQLYKNLGNGKFKNVTHEAGLDLFGTAMGVAILDINHDGFFDLYVTTTVNNQLLINQKNGKFKDIGEEANVADVERTGWGVSGLDFDNNGEEEIFVVNGLITKGPYRLTEYQKTMLKVNSTNRLFIMNKPLHYEALQEAPKFLNTSMGRGLAIADLNNDGNIDLAITNRNNDNLIIYKNKGSDNKSIQVKLVGTKSNRMAVGSKVAIYIGDKVQYKLVTAGSSFSSQSSNILHFGVGKAKQVDKIIVTWPNGHQQTLHGIDTGRIITIIEK